MAGAGGSNKRNIFRAGVEVVRGDTLMNSRGGRCGSGDSEVDQ